MALTIPEMIKGGMNDAGIAQVTGLPEFYIADMRARVAGKAASYSIQISEAQRAILVAALTAAHGSAPGNFGGAPTDEPLDLRTMLDELPANEADCPRALHGLCL